MESTQLPCRICERKSTGIHYGVISCEGCKAFYKRSVEKSAKYRCCFENQCDITQKKAGRCKSCRLRKCQLTGMSFQAVKMGRTPKLARNQLPSDLPQSDVIHNNHTPATEQISVHEHPAGHFGVIRWQSDSRKTIQVEEEAEQESDVEDSSLPLPEARNPTEAASSSLVLRNSLSDALDVRHQGSLAAHLRSQHHRYYRIPAFLGEYWDLMKERSMSLQKTAATVLDAIEVVYGPEIKLWSEFMLDALVSGNIPVQPQTTMKRMMEIIQETLKDSIVKTGTFITMLPGFCDLDAVDQRTIIIEKYLIIWLVHHARFIRNGEMYYVVGPENVHYCRYWLERLFAEPEYFRTVFSFAAAVNDIGLTLTETYLLGAVAVFRPDTTNARNKSVLAFTHSYYLDVLFYLVGKRLSGAERAVAYTRLEALIATFPVVHKLAVNYVNAWQLASHPIRTSTGISFRTLLSRD